MNTYHHVPYNFFRFPSPYPLFEGKTYSYDKKTDSSILVEFFPNRSTDNRPKWVDRLGGLGVAGNPVHAGCVTRVHHPTAEISPLEGNVCRVRVRFSYLCPTVCLYTRCLAFVIVSRRTRAKRGVASAPNKPSLFISFHSSSRFCHASVERTLPVFPSREFFSRRGFLRLMETEREKFDRVVFYSCLFLFCSNVFS